MGYNLKYKPYGERSILIEWPAFIDKDILQDIIQFKEVISENKLKQTVELKLAYNSLLIVYGIVCRNFENEVEVLKKLYRTANFKHDILSKIWKIPVCYDDIFGIDLEEITRLKGLSKNEIIAKHLAPIYTVYFIGFLPGFLYLGGIDESLIVPRKSTPRLKIEKGAVGIGGNQTGIYPSESPGGWNIIGNSPIPFFDVTKEVPCFAKPGDQIQFSSITFEEHQTIKLLVDEGVYQMESEVING